MLLYCIPAKSVWIVSIALATYFLKFSIYFQTKFNPFLPIILEHLSCLSEVIEICILWYPLQAISDRTLDTFYSPVKAKSDRMQELWYITE
jgi:hypothetical protein